MTRKVIIEDNCYDLTPAYQAGIEASRNGVSFHSNPYRDGSQRYYDWNHGHENESDNVPN